MINCLISDVGKEVQLIYYTAFEELRKGNFLERRRIIQAFRAPAVIGSKGAKMIDCLKMNGNGNDFLVVDNLSLVMDASALARAARAVCRRRESVGADGLLALEPSERAAFRMRLFNRDGSEGEMCGNGARCAARFAFDRGYHLNFLP